MSKTWDIFCCVIDNFGDIGVCWRLARQLAAEHDINVRLWVDDLTVFSRLNSDVDPKLSEQQIQGVMIYSWQKQDGESWLSIRAADVVIEAFACDLPTSYIDAMAQRSPQSLWLNLDYLSAEAWVEECHGLASPQLKGPNKYFFFPGFTPKTGGLLREKNLIEQRLNFQQNPIIRQEFLQTIGVKPKVDSLLISLFAYENTSLKSWLDELAVSQQPIHLLVPQGKIVADLMSWLNATNDKVFKQLEFHQRGSLSVQFIDFLSQDDYDRLLWSCDFNCVRGEDSFVRAQWAGKPFLWHIYPQQDNIHLDKLVAFLEIYNRNLTPAASLALSTLWKNWNNFGEMSNSWQEILKNMTELNQNAENWCFQQTKQINIAESLVEFYQNWLK